MARLTLWHSEAFRKVPSLKVHNTAYVCSESTSLLPHLPHTTAVLWTYFTRKTPAVLGPPQRFTSAYRYGWSQAPLLWPGWIELQPASFRMHSIHESCTVMLITWNETKAPQCCPSLSYFTKELYVDDSHEKKKKPIKSDINENSFRKALCYPHRMTW